MRGEFEDAEAALRQAWQIYSAALPEDHWRTADTASLLGGSLVGLGRLEEAEPLLVGAYENLVETRGPEHPFTTAARQRVVDLYTAWDRPADAVQYGTE